MMNFNRIQTALVWAFAGMLLFGCGKLEDLNVNPNQPEAVTPDILLPGVIRDISNTLVGHAFFISNCASQHTAKSLRNEVDIYNWNSAPIIGVEPLWQGLYGALRDIRNMEEAALSSGDDRLLGVALTLKAFAFSVLTDTYGDVPFREALSGSTGVFYPAYDAQESIYLGEGGLLDLLDQAHGLFSAAGAGTVDGDILFGGDSDLWHRFANALHLRLLLHASGQIDVAADFAEVASRPLMQGVAHNAALTYLGAFPNEYPLIPFKTGDFESVRLGEQLFAHLTATSDPRLMAFARPTDETLGSDAEVYEGWINGGKGCDDSGSRLGYAYYDYPGHPVGADKAKGVWLTFAEQEFILAEAALNGWISADAATHYESGIAASMADHGANPENTGLASVADFIAQGNVSWDGTLLRLQEQKWVALYFHGMESYIEVRRWYHAAGGDWAQIPFLTPPCNNANNDALPMRFVYPGEELSLNGASNAAAVEALGSNDFNARMWLVAE